MCGIICHFDITEKKAYESLKELDNRGYESAGMLSIRKGNKIFLKRFLSNKECFAIDQMKEMVDNEECGVCIGHTRWPTHGKKEIQNCHPLNYKGVYVVHNGTLNVENIKKVVTETKVNSETDSIWIAVIYKYLREELGFFEAFTETLNYLRGTYALCMYDEDNPKTVMVAVKGMNLVMGEDYSVCSEPSALLCSSYISLDSGEMFVLKDGLIHSSFGKFTFKEYTKGRTLYQKDVQTQHELKYDTYTEQEIYEQVNVLQMDNKITFNPSMNVVFIGAGSSYHACLFLQHFLLKQMVTLNSHVVNACHYIKEEVHHIVGDTTIICISQSGESKDTIECYQDISGELQGKERRLNMVALVNMPNSKLDRLADYTIYLNCGKEYGVAATKSFTAQLLNGIRFLDLKGNVCFKKWRNRLHMNLEYMESEVNRMLKNELKGDFKYMILGSNQYYPIALEASLKISELANIPVFVQPVNGLKHGYLSLLDSSWYVFLLFEDTLIHHNTMHELEANSIPFTLITESLSILEASQVRIRCPDPYLGCFHVIFFFQFLALRLANREGKCVDKPRHLCKTVAV